MTDNVRQLTDARALAALAHPLRRRMLDVLRVYGPSTASQLAERTGQAVGNASHHLKVLAAVELVVEAPELARDRRERWWRTAGPTRWAGRDFAADESSAAIERAASAVGIDRQVGFVRAYLAAPEEETRRWPDGPFSTETWLRMTDAELAAFAAEVIELHRRWADRELPDDGQERRPVFAFARAVPAQP
ncbi:MAG TPA: helix-turn-helix domain-containing protein [Jatrophihabitans sp.]|nr:helix-turn-helix domain-containing protein [Jatrophihabitans sp.]